MLAGSEQQDPVSRLHLFYQGSLESALGIDGIVEGNRAMEMHVAGLFEKMLLIVEMCERFPKPRCAHTQQAVALLDDAVELEHPKRCE